LFLMKKITAHFTPELTAHFKPDKGAHFHRILQSMIGTQPSPGVITRDFTDQSHMYLHGVR